jgi:hypothetical protein
MANHRTAGDQREKQEFLLLEGDQKGFLAGTKKPGKSGLTLKR